jgi:stress-induced morphogen
MSEFTFVEELITAKLQDAKVFVEDMTGTRDHLAITVVSDAFKGKLLIEQHQMLMDILKEELKARIHAVKLQTMTHQKYEQSQQG